MVAPVEWFADLEQGLGVWAERLRWVSSLASFCLIGRADQKKKKSEKKKERQEKESRSKGWIFQRNCCRCYLLPFLVVVSSTPWACDLFSTCQVRFYNDNKHRKTIIYFNIIKIEGSTFSVRVGTGTEKMGKQISKNSLYFPNP